LHIWLIVFVGLWLAFTVISVLLYTGREELVSRASKAEADAERYMRKNEASRFGVFLDLAGEKQSLARVLDNERIGLARLIGVDETTSAAAAANLINEAVKNLNVGVPSDAALRDLSNTDLLTVMREIQARWKAQAAAAQDAVKKLTDVAVKLKELEDRQAKERDQFRADLADRDAKIKKLDADNKKLQSDADRQVKDLQQQLSKLRDEADEQLIKAQAEIRKVQQENNQLRSELKRSQEHLMQFRPQVVSLGLATQADGQIVRARPDEDVVYINLGQEDHLTLGLRFEVFSASTEVDPNGEGKATIEVVGIHPKTAECRVLQSRPGDPIVPGDLVVNVVYDRTRKYRFVVEGLFDLAGTGKSDPQDPDRIKAWIEAWGGEVVTLPPVPAKVEKCSACGQALRQEGLGLETVDFVVLGAAPPVPPRVTPETKPEERSRIEAQRAAYDRFTRVQQQAKDLSVAVLTQSQFLHFIGFSVKSKGSASPEKGKQAAMVK